MNNKITDWFASRACDKFSSQNLHRDPIGPFSLFLYRDKTDRSRCLAKLHECESTSTLLVSIVDPVVHVWCKPARLTTLLKLALFWSPLKDLIGFGMAGKLLTSATRWCSPFVDSVSRNWKKPKKSLIGCWAPMATTFGQSAPSRVQLTAGRNGHYCPFWAAVLGQFSLRWFVYGKNRAVRVVGRVFPWRTSLAQTDGSETRGFCMHGHDLTSDCQGYFVKRPRKNRRTQQIYA